MEYANPDALVETDWLAQRLDDPSIRIVDATWFMPNVDRSAKDEVAARHIPGAVTLVAVGRGQNRGLCRLHLPNGIQTAGAMVASLCSIVVESSPNPGVHCVEEVTDLHTVLARMRDQGTVASNIQLQADEALAFTET